MTSAQIFKILVTTGFFYLSLDCMGNQNYPWVQTDQLKLCNSQNLKRQLLCLPAALTCSLPLFAFSFVLFELFQFGPETELSIFINCTSYTSVTNNSPTQPICFQSLFIVL